MNPAVPSKAEGAAARPLHVLVPLIKQDLRKAKEAADEAALPHWLAAGEKMLEAKEHFIGRMKEFDEWLRRNFDISRDRSYEYMKVAEPTNWRARAEPTISAAIRASGREPRGSARGGAGWHDPVKEAIGRVNIERLSQDVAARKQEREIQRKLALSLIDIGYKALASKLHPDKGGSKEAMARLNQVRDRLKGCA